MGFSPKVCSSSVFNKFDSIPQMHLQLFIH
uniref:Uncharacterized protein n=1 Tax=Arundo donax TaxID=35708 RepID=A0A0A9EGL5_ARUDO